MMHDNTLRINQECIACVIHTDGICQIRKCTKVNIHTHNTNGCTIFCIQGYYVGNHVDIDILIQVRLHP